MSRIIRILLSLAITVIFAVGFCVDGYGATNGVVDKITMGDHVIFKIAYATIDTPETFTLPQFSGFVYRVIITSGAGDADATLTIKDLSGVNWLSLPAGTFTASHTTAVDICPYQLDQNNNVALGKLILGKHTGTLTAGAGLTSATIWIYCGK